MSGTDDARPTRPSRRELGIAAAAILLGLFVFWQSRDLATMAADAPGPGLVPKVLAGLFVVLGIALAVREVRSPSGARAAPSLGGQHRVLAVFGVLALTVLLWERLGFLVASFLLMCALVFGVERRVTLAGLTVVVATPLATWTVFAIWLDVRLPPGIFYF